MSSHACFEPQGDVKRWSLRARRCLVSGILILVPFAVTLIVVSWLFGWVRRLLNPLITKTVQVLMHLPNIAEVPPIYLKILVSGAAVLMVLALLYLIGSIGTRVVGKRLISTLEGLIRRVPLAGTLYSATKQVADTFGSEERPAYKSVVLVEFPRPGCKAVGFLMGYVTLSDNQRFGKVFIPTAPNPTTGFFELMPAGEIEQVAMTVEDAFKMIISAGLVSPDIILNRVNHGA